MIPVYNEEDNIVQLLEEIVSSIQGMHFEVIFVNDDSTDRSHEILLDLTQKYKDHKYCDLVVVDLRRNSGQTAAMKAGFNLTKGKYVVSMDGDGQNDPQDIPKMYKIISTEKVDVICGWRKQRKDPLTKKIPSKISNFLHRRLTGLKIHDSGCSLRIYIAEAVKDLPIHGEDHRFLPAIIHSRGFKITEMVVHHRQRSKGQSKYGFSRLYRGYLDLLSTTFVHKTGIKPFQFYSKIAMIPAIIGTGILIFLSYVKLVLGESIGSRPLLLLGVLLEIFAIQFFTTGLMSEIISTSAANQLPKYSVRSVERSKDGQDFITDDSSA